MLWWCRLRLWWSEWDQLLVQNTPDQVKDMVVKDHINRKLSCLFLPLSCLYLSSNLTSLIRNLAEHYVCTFSMHMWLWFGSCVISEISIGIFLWRTYSFEIVWKDWQNVWRIVCPSLSTKVIFKFNGNRYVCNEK